MTERYACYEELRDRGLALRQAGYLAAGDALLELARLILSDQEREAAAALRRLPMREKGR